MSQPAFVSKRLPDVAYTPFVSNRFFPNKAASEQIYPLSEPIKQQPQQQPVNTGFESRRTGPINYKTFFGMYRRKHPRTSANKIAKKYELAMSLMGF